MSEFTEFATAMVELARIIVLATGMVAAVALIPVVIVVALVG